MDSPHTTIYLVRHGQTDWNKEERLQGHSDIPLNETGKGQARETGEVLKDVHFDAVFASDLSRAVQTAEIVKLERELAVTTSKLIRERNFGSYEGRPSAEYWEARETLAKLAALSEDEKIHVQVADVEPTAQTIARVTTFLREIAVAYENKTVLVVSHGGVMGMLLVHLGWAKPWSVKIGNAAFVELQSDGVEFEVVRTHNIEKLTKN